MSIVQMFNLPIGWNDPFSVNYIGEATIAHYEREYNERIAAGLTDPVDTVFSRSDLGIFEGYGEFDDRFGDDDYVDNPNFDPTSRDYSEEPLDPEEEARFQQILADQRRREDWEAKNPAPTLGDIFLETILKNQSKSA